ncbi:MAG: hypothetical protein FJZ59_00005, partial [Chlamydiae bacterium]|nr:hypothetical protein [Chlamydiota bacterium]
MSVQGPSPNGQPIPDTGYIHLKNGDSKFKVEYKKTRSWGEFFAYLFGKEGSWSKESIQRLNRKEVIYVKKTKNLPLFSAKTHRVALSFMGHLIATKQSESQPKEINANATDSPALLWIARQRKNMGDQWRPEHLSQMRKNSVMESFEVMGGFGDEKNFLKISSEDLHWFEIWKAIHNSGSDLNNTKFAWILPNKKALPGFDKTSYRKLTQQLDGMQINEESRSPSSIYNVCKTSETSFILYRNDGENREEVKDFFSLRKIEGRVTIEKIALGFGATIQNAKLFTNSLLLDQSSYQEVNGSPEYKGKKIGENQILITSKTDTYPKEYFFLSKRANDTWKVERLIGEQGIDENTIEGLAKGLAKIDLLGSAHFAKIKEPDYSIRRIDSARVLIDPERKRSTVGKGASKIAKKCYSLFQSSPGVWGLTRVAFVKQNKISGSKIQTNRHADRVRGHRNISLPTKISPLDYAPHRVGFLDTIAEG